MKTKIVSLGLALLAAHSVIAPCHAAFWTNPNGGSWHLEKADQPQRTQRTQRMVAV